MRLSVFLYGLLVVSPAAASWFGSDKPEYTTWDKAQLEAWLTEHNIQVPKGFSQKELEALVKSNWDASKTWTADQYNKAQQVFANVKENTFEAWDESKLREFLLEQGIVDPSGPRESLILAAKQHYRAYTSAASSFASTASASASTAMYGDTSYQASKSLSSVIATATSPVVSALDDSKDYIYSTWSDNQLRTYLEEKGVIKTKTQASRDEMLAYMRNAYAKTTNPVWQAWSDSYIRYWLIEHNIIKSDFEKSRDKLSKQMNKYYYDVNQSVWDTWTESELRDWLISHGIIKTNAQLKREKLEKLVRDNYTGARDTIWGGWKDSDIRTWLIDNGYLRSDAEVKRDQLVKLINDKYKETSASTAAYLTWPDARLRAYLREHGMPESALPTSRPGLLQEVRIRWVQTRTRSENLLVSIRDTINSGVEIAEEKLGAILEILTGTADDAKTKAKKANAEAVKEANVKSASAASAARSLSAEAVKASKKAAADL